MDQESVQWVSRVFERSSKGISGKFPICFKGASRKFCFLICSCMDRIAATRAEGGLVFLVN